MGGVPGQPKSTHQDVVSEVCIHSSYFSIPRVYTREVNTREEGDLWWYVWVVGAAMYL